MTGGTSQGLFIVVAIVIFGIFVALSYTVFGSDGLSGGMQGLFDTSIQRVDKAQVESFDMSDLVPWESANWVYDSDNNTVTFSNIEDYALYAGGFYIPVDFFEYGNTYTLTFNMTKLSGDIEQIGGHLRFATETDVRINGETPVVWEDSYHPLDVNSWSKSLNYINDTETNKIEITFTYDIASESTPRMWIQPNRSTIFSDKRPSYTVEFSDVKLFQHHR